MDVVEVLVSAGGSSSSSRSERAQTLP
jgi:hypothetical protein